VIDSTRHYELKELISGGGFGQVFRAEVVGVEGFRKVVAVKLLRDEAIEAVARLRDEARLLAMIRHPSVVQVEDLVKLGERWGLVMEYIDGPPLSDLSAPMPMGISLAAAARIAHALTAIHGAVDISSGEPLGMIHRDLKPSNVLLSRRGEIKVIDFGVASAHPRFREVETHELRFGSDGFIAPERIRGEPETPGVDIFSLGVILYGLLAGSPLHALPARPEGFRRSVEEALTAIDGVSDGLRELLRSMLAFEAGDRPSAGAVAAALDVAVSQHGGANLRAWAAGAVPETLAGGVSPTLPLSGRSVGTNVWASWVLFPAIPALIFAMWLALSR